MVISHWFHTAILLETSAGISPNEINSTTSPPHLHLHLPNVHISCHALMIQTASPLSRVLPEKQIRDSKGVTILVLGFTLLSRCSVELPTGAC